jgi:uncharacterized protein (TIGR04255 family)
MTTTQEHGPSSSNLRGQAPVELTNPPVGETSIGFYFQRIEGWNPVHQGALWERFQTKYPGLEILPPVVDAAPQPKVVFDFASFLVRTCFVDKTKTQLVQIQDGLVLHNWRKTVDTPEYQRYETIRPLLREDWHNFQAYLRERSFKSPTVTRCEMSYFNHLVRNEEWEDFSDLPKIFTVWAGVPQSPTGGRLQLASFAVSYRLEKGTVNIAVHPGVRSTDGKEIIQFTLSSSVVPNSPDEQELFRCLDECHENAARAFIEFTTQQARERWK